MRKAGGTERVTIDDRFHIGSCTNSMTATLCAFLVEQGKLRWDSTIGEVFADQVDKILPEYNRVTLEQLLRHRSGLREDRTPDLFLWPRIRGLSGPMLEQRRKLVELALAQKPAALPGAEFLYSNIGYTIAGAMCERVTGKTWEDLMHGHLFAPLGMTTAGYGPPGTAEAVDQPWGHLMQLGRANPLGPGLVFSDNPAVIGPAGTVHCSLDDWAKYAIAHLSGASGNDDLLPPETIRRLHTPLGDEDYAFGWIVTERGWAGGRALTHGGSNTLWFAVIWLAPERNAGFVAATNLGTQDAFQGCDAAIGKMIELTREPPAQP